MGGVFLFLVFSHLFSSFLHGSVSDNAYFFGFLQQSARWRGVLRLKLIDGRRDYSETHASNLLALSYCFHIGTFICFHIGTFLFSICRRSAVRNGSMAAEAAAGQAVVQASQTSARSTHRP